jgi:myosin tail region-interacting protein MTI1
MATDIDLSPSSQWYAQTPDVPPPSLQNRSDILIETETSTSSKRGGKTTISKDIYILYMDYSQTIISISFDANDLLNATLEQRHERPPPVPRQDQLEAASHQFGSVIARNAPPKSTNTTNTTNTPTTTTTSDTTNTNTSAHTFILSLLPPYALPPIGTRAYGACIYSNLANASTQQLDEMRAGDIVSFRNAKFVGHRGGLHTKYSVEVGKPDHVAVVAEWDGAKKKIRVWEVGRATKGGAAKVREEAYRVQDLRSGELRVWRVVGREWVGWGAK